VNNPTSAPLTSLADDAFLGARLAGRYRLERVLGRGGMGVVYEAVQEDLGRRVALKLISGTVSPMGLARLRQEAEATARLGSPHIVQVTDFQSNPGEPPFLVMELLGGRSLRALLREERVIGWQRAARFGCQILAALAAAHEAQIIHRDIKPDNIFILASAAVPDMIKVLDFGVAKLLDDADRRMTAAGALLGTLAYMAPEVARGQEIDARADLYAVAVSLYEAVAGRRPILGTDAASLFGALISEDPVPLQRLCPSVPDAFAEVLMRALRKSPDERFQQASEMAAALAACLGPAADEPALTTREGHRQAAEGASHATLATAAASGAAPSPVAATVLERPSAPNVPLGPPRSAVVPQHTPQLLAHRANLVRELASSATWSLAWAGLGIVTCLFPASIAAILLGARAYRLGSQAHEVVPARATAGVTLGIIGCIVSVIALLGGGFAALGYHLERSDKEHLAALEKKVGAKASAAALDQDTACALAELFLLKTGYEGKRGPAIGQFRCIGPLSLSKDHAQLGAVLFSSDFDDYAVNACFTKAAAWSLTELRKDPCPAPPR
jgi:serine/threonine-protein kinase